MMKFRKHVQRVNVRTLANEAKREHAQPDLVTATRNLRLQVVNLRERNGVFGALSIEQRDLILKSIGVSGNGLPDVLTLSDKNLVELAQACYAEVERRSMSVELCDPARRAIEQSVIDSDYLEDRFDSSFFQAAH